MHHLIFLPSKCARLAMIPAVLLCITASGCADEQQPTGPKPVSVARTSTVPFNKFLIAWSQGYEPGPIQMQMFALDARQDRQYGEYYVDQNVLSFASANPGRLYINGDEPDQYCIAPYEYAGMFHDFVAAVRAVDPSARFSPAGFAEPNAHCCPNNEVCSSVHSVAYADQFYNAYVQRYGVAPPVSEWRFHDFAVSIPIGDMNGWWSRVDSEASWSVAHGANMVLGAWGLLGWWREPTPEYLEHMKQAIGRLINDKRINGAVYWSYKWWIDSPRPLANSDGSLTTEGQMYVNPLTDIPTDVEIGASDGGRAALRWTNTTSAWAAEAEFWVQAAGSNSFVYRNTELVPGPGAAQTPLIAFKAGDTVKGRVRYYNAYGQAGWSSFSNTVSMPAAQPPPPPPPPPAAPPDQWGLFRKSPVPCLAPLCQKPLHGVAPQTAPGVSSAQH